MKKLDAFKNLEFIKSMQISKDSQGFIKGGIYKIPIYRGFDNAYLANKECKNEIDCTDSENSGICSNKGKCYTSFQNKGISTI